ncbi:MAG TPA: transposase [Armatimonadota bacterium]|nr:transposase [Armatimonadota bacterium]
MGYRCCINRVPYLIENFFSRLKQYRGIATQYDKTARNFLGAIYLAASVIWLNG